MKILIFFLEMDRLLLQNPTLNFHFDLLFEENMKMHLVNLGFEFSGAGDGSSSADFVVVVVVVIGGCESGDLGRRSVHGEDEVVEKCSGRTAKQRRQPVNLQEKEEEIIQSVHKVACRSTTLCMVFFFSARGKAISCLERHCVRLTSLDASKCMVGGFFAELITLHTRPVGFAAHEIMNSSSTVNARTRNVLFRVYVPQLPTYNTHSQTMRT